MTRKDLNWVFERSLVKLQAGATLESVLAEFPEWKQELQPVLETVLAVWQSRGSDTVPIAAMTRSRERLHEEIQRRQAVAPRLNAWQRWFNSLRMVTVPAIVLLVTISLGLTGLASVQALPGEALYPVKLAAERFTLSLPASASQRLAREENFDMRRSEEVEALIHQQREQEVFFNGYLTRGEDMIWRVDQIAVDVPAEMLDSVSSKIGRYVYVHADLLPDGKMVLEWLEDRLYKISGTVQSIDGTRIRIDGIWVELSPEAALQGSPEVGEDVTVSVVRLSEDNLLAVELTIGGGQQMELNPAPTERPGEEAEFTSQAPAVYESNQGDQNEDSGDSSTVDKQSTPEPRHDTKPTESRDRRRSPTPEPTRKWDDHREERTRDPKSSPKPTEKHDD